MLGYLKNQKLMASQENSKRPVVIVNAYSLDWFQTFGIVLMIFIKKKLLQIS
jgi:hypothetical protein